MPFLVGLTGGIGSGKTTVGKVFQVLGIPIFNSDLEAKTITDTHPKAKELICTEFGADLYQEGVLDRKKLAALVFNNPVRLQRLNAIIHPLVKDAFMKWMEAQKTKKVPYLMQESALLFETSAHEKLDQILLISSSLEDRIERIKKRDQLTEKEILARINNQLPEEEKIKKANFIITNSEQASLIEQVLKIHQELIVLAKKSH